MINMAQVHMKFAQDALRAALEDVFGPRLVGVNGFGAGLNKATREPHLQVLVDGPVSEQVAARLPKYINGLPVTVRQRGPAVAE